MDAFESHRFFLIMRENQSALLLVHYPTLQVRIIGIPYEFSPGFWFITEERFTMMNLPNIMTQLMIPLASSVCDEIGIAGCTGREKGETYFWKHNGRTQYIDLMDSVFEMWPAFFHWRRYEAYYDEHCQTVEEELQYGERLGKHYLNLTTSFIPALKARNRREKSE